MPDISKHRWWNPVHLVALFGRYTRDQKGESPHDGILVGREGQRTFIMDVLNPRSGPGAYLITGHRGAGKTSFISTCLREYEEDVFTRFLSSKVGRALLWDRIGLALVGLCASGALVVLFELISLLTAQAFHLHSWLLISPLLLLGFVPIIYGWQSIAAATSPLLLQAQSTERAIPLDQARRLLMHGAGLIIFLSCAALLPLANHAYGLALLFFAGSCGVATIQMVFPPGTTPAANNSSAPHITLIPLGRIAAFFIPGFLLGGWFHLHVTTTQPQQHQQPETILFLIIIGAGVFAIGTIAQAALAYHIQPERPKVLRKSALRAQLRRGLSMLILLFFALGALLLWLHIGANQHARVIREYGLLLVAVSVGGVIFIGWAIDKCKRCHALKHMLTEHEPEPDWSRTTAIFLFKGICAFAIGLQVLHVPIARLLDNQAAHSFTDWLPRYSLPARLAQPEVLLFQEHTQPLWVVTILATATLIYTIEYDWILIPFQRLRQDSARRPHDLPTGELRAETRRIAVRQASQTLPWRVLDAWLPVMTVSVNLGTDRLPYAEIVRAMLSAMRDRYALRFVSIRSGFALTVWIGALGIMLAITTAIGGQLFWPRAAPDATRWTPATITARTAATFGITSILASGETSPHLGLAATVLVVVDPHVTRKVPDLRSILLDVDRGIVCESVSKLDGADYLQLPAAIRIGCASARPADTKPVSESATLQILYFDLLQSPLGRRSKDDLGSSRFFREPFDEKGMLLCKFLPCDVGADIDDSSMALLQGPSQRHALHFRGYHLVILAAAVLLTRFFSWIVPVLPYRRNLSTIDEALDRLTSRRVLTPPGAISTFASALNGMLGRTQVQSKEIDRENARTVETSFISIVESIQSNALPILGSSGRAISLPAPEIVFLFDELDKVGVRFDPRPDVELDGDREPNPANQGPLDAERLRSLALHRLLSDMKSLLSSTPARFLFVGGRNLHDEWIADRTARLPLLSSIFRAEIYLPSLLSDLPRDKQDQWLTRIHQYVRVQHSRAEEEHFRGRIALLQPRTLERRSLARSTRFAAPPHQFDRNWLLLHEVRGGRPLRGSFTIDLERDPAYIAAVTTKETENNARDEIHEQFLHFLAYRSIGNPKRLRDILEAMIRPTARLVEVDASTNTYPCTEALSVHGMVQHSEHSLHLSEPMRYRLQMISETYGVLASSFAARYANRDDKLAVSLFNLADFLFRFHGRGFSWSNLERVDELVHVHRAHDHRRILEELVHRWSDRFLLQVLNGMYDFRFRSNIAREIEYISRQSEEEMAAFNFTLDESEPLKALYKVTFARMEKEQTPDAMAALGELHELDQEYDLARFYYQRSIDRMDEIHRKLVGGGDGERLDTDGVWLALSSNALGLEGARKHMTWGIHRLRLMLHIGMTFEISRNYERAAVEYRNARTLARALLRAMLDDEGRRKDETMPGPSNRAGGGRAGFPGPSRRHLLKHMNIVFQPAFAEAWLAEKMSMGVDTSLTLIESELRQIREMLPFVRDSYHEMRRDGRGDHEDGNLALVMAELHDKAGDLYFFKGRQVVEHSRSKRTDTGWEIDLRVYEQAERHRGKTDGYQLRAHEHYALAIHEIRRFIRHRLSLSTAWNLRRSEHDLTDPPATVERGGWPDYVLRVTGNTMCDLAEGTLGRISFFGVLASIQNLSPESRSQNPLRRYRSEVRRDVETGVGDFDLALRAWMEPWEPWKQSVTDSTALFVGTLNAGFYGLGRVEDWLGGVPRRKPARGAALRLEFSTRHTEPQRLLFALYSNWVAANMLRQAGYTEDAAHELMQIADAAAQFLWWATCAQSIQTVYRNRQQEDPKEPWVRYLCSNWEHWSKTAHWDPFWDHIIDVGLCSLRKAMIWFKRSRSEPRTSSSKSHEDTASSRDCRPDLPIQLAVIGCSIGLAGQDSRWHTTDASKQGRAKDRLEILCSMMKEIVGDIWLSLGPEPTNAKEMKKRLALLLKEIYLRYPYPMLTRLHALKIFIDNQIFSKDRLESTGSTDDDEIISAALHLKHLASQFNADTLFTPFHVGFTLASAYLLTDHHERDETLRNEARKTLSESEEAVTMRRAYYESIERLYYLYDGFNDRDIHFNHALQMASLEVCLLLKHALDDKKEDWTRK